MLRFKTRDETSPNGKTWVFLCALPLEAEAQLPMICEDIFRFCNCAIWYDDGADTSPDDLEAAVAQSGMAVLPVTADLLHPDSPIQRHILPMLHAHRVSILPVLDDPNLLDAFNARFQNIQILDRYSKDSTAIPYEEKLKRFLDTMVLRDDLADRVKQAFRSRLFLSYRKKDRAMATDLMKRIHKDPRCRSISIWYDEFLTPGEDFDGNIAQAIRESDLFLLALTQNMVGEPNYVISKEYPCARDAGKKILPVELEAVDPALVRRCFPGIPTPTDSANAARYLAQPMGEGPGNTAEQDYLLGLAFIHGFHVARHIAVGLEQLELSAQWGYAPAALQLASLQILEYSPEEQQEHKLRWLRKYAALASEDYTQAPGAETARQYADALDRAAEAEFTQHPRVSFACYQQAIQVLANHGCLEECAQILSNYGLKLVDAGKNQDGQHMLMKALQLYTDQYNADPEWGKRHAAQLSYCYYNIGVAAAHAGELKLAEIGFTSAIHRFTVLAREKPEDYTLVLAQAYGNLANIYRQQWVGTGEPEHLAKAEGFHIQAIEILNRMISWDPSVYEPAYALELVSLASVFLQKKDHSRTKIALDEAIRYLRVYEERYPGQYLDILASALGNRAVLFLSQDRIENARVDLDAAISIFRQIPGRQMELAKSLWNMANTYSMEDDFPPARLYFEEAVAIYESGAIQGADRSPDFAQCCHNFANTLYNSGNYREALTWANRAIGIYQALQAGSGEAYASQIEDLRQFSAWLARNI